MVAFYNSNFISDTRVLALVSFWENYSIKGSLEVMLEVLLAGYHGGLMPKQGIHPKVVQERLSPATISTTLDTYSHILPGLQEAAAQRYDDIPTSRATKSRQWISPLANS